MIYRYKKSPTGALLERKARCALRGDRMIAHVHFNTTHTAAPTSEKATVRLVISIAAALRLNLVQLDLKSAFVHEPYEFEKPVYVKQHPRFKGAMKHTGCSAGIMIKNVYGTTPGRYYYLRVVEEWLLHTGFLQSQDDPCPFFLPPSHTEYLILTLTIDDFLVAATSINLINWFHKALNSKYPNSVKNLGFPSTYLGWRIQKLTGDGINTSLPNCADTALKMLRMTDCNGKSTSYAVGTHYHDPDDNDKRIPPRKANYQQVLGELRYLAECTRPDITFVVNRISCANHGPTMLHWHILKQLLRIVQAKKKLRANLSSHTPSADKPHNNIWRRQLRRPHQKQKIHTGRNPLTPQNASGMEF